MSEFESEPGGSDELDVEQYAGGGDVALVEGAPDWAAEIIADHHVDAEPGPGEQPEPEAPSWSGISRDEWEQTQQAVQYFASLVADAEETAQEQAEVEQWEAEIAEYLGDEWDPEYEQRLAEVQRAQLAEEVRAYIDERVAPLDELQEHFAEQQVFASAEAEAGQVLVESFAPFGFELDAESRADLIEFANRELPKYQQQLVSQGMQREVAYGRETALVFLQGLGPYFVPMIEAANQPPGDLIDVARRHGQGGDEMDVAARYRDDAGRFAQRPPETSPQPPGRLPQTRVDQVFGRGPFNGSWIRPKELS